MCGTRSKKAVDENEGKAMLIVLLATKKSQSKTESRARTEELVEYAFGLSYKTIRKHAKSCCFHDVFVFPSDEDPPPLNKETGTPVGTPTKISAGRRKRSERRTSGSPRLSAVSKPSKAARLGPTPGKPSESDETSLSLFESSNETLNTTELFSKEKDWSELVNEHDTSPSPSLVVQEHKPT